MVVEGEGCALGPRVDLILLLRPNFLFSNMHTFFFVRLFLNKDSVIIPRAPIAFENMLSNCFLVGGLWQCSHGVFYVLYLN